MRVSLQVELEYFQVKNRVERGAAKSRHLESNLRTAAERERHRIWTAESAVQAMHDRLELATASRWPLLYVFPHRSKDAFFQ